ncbi:DEAD/DEAH box helicase [Massilimicrobiota sp. An80]|uniref:DEAD/DEAH box helicase n=1 Tax=Massilimicrobiota sp. An80 TaxID=1965658 RepID=UPI000B4309D5|nr:DEAD/DEAH box helicase [Massilimicrobiota sp. An80]OUN37848.1 NgoFVII family restriction endonuclease [Massilimicrobiota sp. An80]
MDNLLLQERTRLIYNDQQQNKKVITDIENALLDCDTFDISVAFIALSGLASIRETLHKLKVQNKKGRIITSTYLGFNEPKMFKDLLKYPNIEVRVYDDHHGFHSKGYIFQKNSNYWAIVGSSNLTQSALSLNQEWNVYVSSHKQNDTIKQIQDEFENQWQRSIPLTHEWINEYQKNYVKPEKHAIRHIKRDIVPNYMQRQALASLEHLRQQNQGRALLISATGTGKTYLSAFDVQKVKPRRMLFVVHRKSIALKAMETFQTIIKDKTMGIFSGNVKELDKDYLFSTVQTIHKKENRELFKQDEFDYIIIDEVHKAGAYTYQELVHYFHPQFLLGMSATPERNDQFDIYKMFHYNIAYEIRLQQAMEYDLLCPFHYYGITDLNIDGISIDDKSDFNLLINEKRIDYIIEKIEEYGYSGEKVHGLIFVSRKQEAIELSNLFNQRGYNTIALTGDDNEEKRQEAMDRLESNDEDGLDYIFTVDIFNEGIDIPKVNQVVMLRPTQSAIIFVQQLGRGLRKNDEKDYVVVIDFIGNYERNFLIPIALSGNTNLNKDTLRQFITERNVLIPGVSTIQFDEISQKRIFESIDHANFNDVKLIKESYVQLKAKLGRIPHIKDFEKYGAIDIQKIFQNKGLGSYHMFLKKYEKEYDVQFSSLEEKYLQFISSKLSSAKRVQELEAIKLAIERKVHVNEYLKQQMLDEYQIQMPEVSYTTIQNILTQNFATGSSKDAFKDVPILDTDWNISHVFQSLLNNEEFKRQVLEVIDYSIDLYKREYSQRYQNTDLCLYKKYTYEDVCQLLNWEKNLVPLNIGGYKYDQHTNTLPVFINYDKEEDIADTIKYTDHFVDPQTLVAMSKSKLKLGSKGMDIFTQAKQRQTIIHIFVRKNKDDKTSKEFYYLGIGNIINIKQEYMADQIPVCEILYHLDQPVRQDIYDYIVK